LQSAFLYSGLNLNSEAIKTLRALITSCITESWIYRQLGQLYWEAGVSLLAETNYQEAAKLAIASQNISEQAQISTALGGLYAAMGEEKESIKWLTQAKDSHKTLGNRQRAKELDIQIEQMKSLVKSIKP
jgi:tetratricopeptide (TPR) repeat protein